jgi:hypothetical protein
LDAGADFTDFACCFEDLDAVAGEQKGDGGTDAAETGTYDDDLGRC